jgi:hypothetical protein
MGKFYVNVPIILPTKKSTNKVKDETQIEKKRFKYEYVSVNQEYYLALKDLIRRIMMYEISIPNLTWKREIRLSTKLEDI